MDLFFSDILINFKKLSWMYLVRKGLRSNFAFLSHNTKSMATSAIQNSKALKLALIQNIVGMNKQDNINRAFTMVRKAKEQGANMISLPECFNSPYGTNYFGEYAEPIPGPTTKQLRSLAQELGVYLIGGSIPERDEGKLYNTATAFSPTGELLLKFRKMHLFDIDIPGKITFKESDSLSSGSKLGWFDTDWCRVGVAICYDIRFPQLAMLMSQQGCNLLVYPGCFNMTTGPAHWELLLRARALDNQCFCCAVSQARVEKSSYVAWGHSTICNPWGEVIGKAEAEEGIVLSEIDLERVKTVRDQIPIRKQIRSDIYSLSSFS